MFRIQTQLVAAYPLVRVSLSRMDQRVFSDSNLPFAALPLSVKYSTVQ